MDFKYRPERFDQGVGVEIFARYFQVSCIICIFWTPSEVERVGLSLRVREAGTVNGGEWHSQKQNPRPNPSPTTPVFPMSPQATS